MSEYKTDYADYIQYVKEQAAKGMPIGNGGIAFVNCRLTSRGVSDCRPEGVEKVVADTYTPQILDLLENGPVMKRV